MPDDDDYGIDDEPAEDESPVIRTLRKKLKAAEAEAAKVGALSTENAILKAGLDGLSDKQRQALIATHEGDVTAEGLRKTAEELGFQPTDAKDEPEPQVTPEQQAGYERIAQATSAAQPAEGRELTLEDRLNAAKNPAEIMSILREADMVAEEQAAPTPTP